MEIKVFNTMYTVYNSMSSTGAMTQTGDSISKHPTEPVTDTWINVDGSNPHTYESSNLRSFLWASDPKYEYGKLLVRFQGSGLYVYDMPKSIFMEMAERAFEPEKHAYTTGEWYSNKFYNHAKRIHGYKENYYIENIDV